MDIIPDRQEYQNGLSRLMAYLLINYTPVRLMSGDEVGLNNCYFRFDFNLQADDPGAAPEVVSVLIEGTAKEISHGANVVIEQRILEEALSRLFDRSWQGYDVYDTPLIKLQRAMK